MHSLPKYKTFSTTTNTLLYCDVYFQGSKSTYNASLSNILRQVFKAQFWPSYNTQARLLCQPLGSPNPKGHLSLSELSATLLSPSAWLSRAGFGIIPAPSYIYLLLSLRAAADTSTCSASSRQLTLLPQPHRDTSRAAGHSGSTGVSKVDGK